MVLKDNLYTIVDIDKENSVVEIAMCPNCIIYNAHFPDHPITPGVCVIQIAVEVLGQLLGCECFIQSVQNAKFLYIICPQNTTNVSFVFSGLICSDDQMIKTNVSVISVSDKRVYAKMSILCKAS